MRNALEKLSFSETVRKLNPELFGPRKVEAQKPKPTPAPALVGSKPESKIGNPGVAFCCHFIAMRHRLLDDDNNVTSFKPLRDAIAATLGIDDRDKRVTWKCDQCLTAGEEEVLVRIETL